MQLGKHRGVSNDGPFSIVVIPSHSPQKKTSGVHTIGSKVCSALPGWIDATQCLVRTQEIQKLSYGGDRSEQVHRDSMKVMNEETIAGREVLLLDDIVTSGNSMKVGRQKLLEASAKSVCCVAFAGTV